MICWNSGSILSRSNPLPMSAMKSTPTTVRQMAPSPPRIDVPPTTMPASTVNVSVDTARVVCALNMRDVSMTPASAAATPLSGERDDAHAVDADAGQPGRLRVAPGGVDDSGRTCAPEKQSRESRPR